MKKLIHIIGTGVCMFLASLNMASCVDGNDWEVTPTNRLFGSTKGSATPAAITADVTWEATPNTEYYIIEVSQEALSNDQAMGTTTGSIVYGEDKSITKSPYTLTGLLSDTEYYLRIKSMSEGKESRWMYLESTFKTLVEQILNNVAKEDIEDEAIRVTWKANLAVTHLFIQEGEAVPIQRDITQEEVEAGEATIEGLTPGTAYVISIYQDEIKRGELTVSTSMSEMAESEISNLTKTSAKLTWDSEIGTITHYAWCEGTRTPTTSDHYTALTDEQMAAGIELTGLQPSTTYTIAVMKNSYVRAMQTFTTNKGIPAGFTKIVVGSVDEWNAAISGNAGKVAILIPGGTTLDITGATANIPAAITSLLVWGADPESEDKAEIKPDIKLKGLSFIGDFETIELYNLYLHHDDNANNFVIYHTGTGNIRNLLIESCKVDKIRGIIRAKSATGSCNYCSINDSEITGIGSYGLFATSEAASWILSTVSLTNSTISKASGGPLLKTKQEASFAIKIDKCTLYEANYSPLLDTQSKSATVNISNTLIGGSATNIKAFGDNVTMNSDENVYTTSDFSYHNTYKWGEKLEEKSADLFTAPASGDFTVKVADYKTYGDPRWNK